MGNVKPDPGAPGPQQSSRKGTFGHMGRLGKTNQEGYRNCTSVLCGRPQGGPSPRVASPGLATLLGQRGE